MTDMVTLPRGVVQDAAWALETLDYESTDETRRAAKALRAALAAQPSADLNLSCKSVQARLAAQWGYVRAAQPSAEPVVTITATRDELLGRIANALCDNHARVCGVNRDDAWKLYADDFYVEAYNALKVITGERDVAK